MKITNTKKMLIALFTCAICLLSLFCVAKILNKESIVAKAETCSVLNENEPTEKESFVISEQLEYQTEESDLKEITQLNMEGELMPDKENVDSEISAISDESTYVQGTLQWIDDDGNYHPLRKIKVEIYDFLDDEWHLISDTLSNNNGIYSFEINLASKSIIKVIFNSGDSNVMVENSSGIIYSNELTESVVPGEIYNLDMTVDMNSEKGQAFQISQAIITARDFANEMLGFMPSDLKLIYPSGEHASYIKNKIFITHKNKQEENCPNSYASWDMIMHEYGHHIQYEFDMGFLNSYKHYSEKDDAKFYGKADGIQLSWSESWPTIFGILAQQYYLDNLNDIKTVGDSFYTAYNELNYDVNKPTGDFCESCEASIMAVLWDLYDDDTETNDTIALGYKEFCAATTRNRAKTFSEFITGFYKDYPQYKDAIGANLSYYKMASDNLKSQNVSLIKLPQFSWSANGNSGYFRNNKFILSFYDIDKNLIFNTEELYSTSYSLNADEWNKLLSLTGSYFYWTVEALNDYENIVTGPYISSYQKVSKTFVNQIPTQKKVKIKLSEKNNYYWFKFIAPNCGTYTFNSEGYADTWAELYSQMYSFTSYKLAFDEGTGKIKHFKITFTMKKGESVFLRVTAPYIQPEFYANFYLFINFDESVHDYICQYMDRTYHKYVCGTCEYSYKEEHSFEIVGNEMRCKCGYSLGTSVPGGGIQSVGDTANVYINQFLKITDKMYCKKIKYNI